MNTFSTPADLDTYRCLGRGRSGVVYLIEPSGGPKIARKIFDSGILTRLVQVLFLGAANPYAWSEHAIRGALLRRRILAEIVPFALDNAMGVARAFGHGWDEVRAVMTLDTEYIEGSHPALHHPLARNGKKETDELRRDLLPRLQGLLRETGFDGMLWQAGLGNPVAFANFLLRKNSSHGPRWYWVDLESGVPALFPASLRALFCTYLPLSIKHRAPLFDHTDTIRLTAWLTRNRAGLDAVRGPGTGERLLSECAALEVSGLQLMRQSRLQRSISSQIAKGTISVPQAEFFSRRPLRWRTREALRGIKNLASTIGQGLIKLRRQYRRVLWREIPSQLAAFLLSQDRREQVARAAISLRIDQWVSRGSLSPEHASQIRQEVQDEESSAWISDFAVHMAIKPMVKATVWILFPLLLMRGAVDEATVAVVILVGGSVSRTLYTAWRTVQEIARGGHPPWVALGVGAIPALGNLAFPAQIAWTGHEDKNLPAQFLLYDGMTLIGRRLPIWGGLNTLTEQLANHATDRFVLRRQRPTP